MYPGVCLGLGAQILRMPDLDDGHLVVGPRTILRENVNIHAGNPKTNRTTRVGADCFMMFSSHLGHDTVIGDKCVIANAVQIGGECVLGDQVWCGGFSTVHQQSWIGDHAFIGGGSVVVTDVVPFAMTVGNHAIIAGINVVGLKRRGFTKQQVRTIRAVYKRLFNDKTMTFRDRLENAQNEFGDSDVARTVFDFIAKDRVGRPLCQMS